jgi:DNA recombination protein RmuC
MEALLFLIGLICGAAFVAALLGRRGAAARAEATAARVSLDREQAHHEARLADLQGATEKQIALISGNREQLAEQMKAISTGVLRETAEQVTKLAEEARRADREVATAELGKRTEEIKRVLDPVSKHLEKVQAQVEHLERERRQTLGTVGQMFKQVTENVERLRTETGTLVNALKRPQVRGAWGEMQLRNVVQAANMTPHVDFHDQVTYTDSDGARLRPDMTVHLPAGRNVVVDSKVPLDAYLAALELPDGDPSRDAELDRHARQLRTHLDTLASKSYQSQLEASPEFVVCFIPNEAIYCAALDRDASLLEHGAGKGVLIATPTTLLALLHAVYFGWRQERIAESAREIAEAARELHRRVGTFLEPFSLVGRQLNSATNAYNKAVGSLESRVLPQLRRIEEAGASSEKELEGPTPLETPARLITAPELAGSEDDEPPAVWAA